MKHELQSLAVLIDADNVRLDTLTPILDAIARLGRVTVRRIYGDFTTPTWPAGASSSPNTPSIPSSNTATPPAKTPATAPSSSTPWTCSTPGASTASAW
jgi:hypothetical protein